MRFPLTGTDMDRALCATSAWIDSMHMVMYGEYDRQQFVDVLMNSFDLIVSSQAIQQI